jgi:hypothetical protein
VIIPQAGQGLVPPPAQGAIAAAGGGLRRAGALGRVDGFGLDELANGVTGAGSA